MWTGFDSKSWHDAKKLYQLSGDFLSFSTDLPSFFSIQIFQSRSILLWLDHNMQKKFKKWRENRRNERKKDSVDVCNFTNLITHPSRLLITCSSPFPAITHISHVLFPSTANFPALWWHIFVFSLENGKYARLGVFQCISIIIIMKKKLYCFLGFLFEDNYWNVLFFLVYKLTATHANLPSALSIFSTFLLGEIFCQVKRFILCSCRWHEACASISISIFVSLSIYWPTTNDFTPVPK